MTELEQAIEQVRLLTLQLRSESARLADVVERLDPDGMGPDDVIEEQKKQLRRLEEVLGALRNWNERETRLRREIEA